MHTDTATSDGDAEALTQFLYMAPIGLMQAQMGGEIDMINPLCAQLLMPLAPAGDLSNLYVALGGLVPDLQQRVHAFTAAHGMVLDGMQLPVFGPPCTVRGPQVLSLSLLKLDAQRLMAVLADVTQVVQQERDLRESRTWFGELASQVADYALLSLDHVGRVRSWNGSIGRLFGHDEAGVVGASAQLLHPADDPTRTQLQQHLADADRWGWSLAEGWRQRADGSRFRASCLITPLHAGPSTPPALRHYSLVVRDVGEAPAAASAMRQSLTCDQVTGLANRRAFFDAATAQLRLLAHSPHPLSLALIDGDQLTQITTQHGPAAAHAVLRHLAAGLRASVRASDTLGRIGGQDFVVLLPGADAGTASRVMQRLLDHLVAQHVLFEGQRFACTASAGIATLGAGTSPDLDDLLARASDALRSASADGGNRLVRALPASGQALAPVVA